MLRNITIEGINNNVNYISSSKFSKINIGSNSEEQPEPEPQEKKYYVHIPRDDDGIVVFDENINQGEFIFNIRLQENNGFYFNLGTTGIPGNDWGWVLHLNLINNTV